MGKALLAIEEAYEIGLNPELDYLAQLEQLLGPSGELANRLTSNKVLFALCKIIDEQEKQIKALEDDRVQIANKMLELEGKAPKTDAAPTTAPQTDPTAPLPAES